MELLSYIHDHAQIWLLQNNLLVQRNKIPTDCLNYEGRAKKNPNGYIWSRVHNFLHDNWDRIVPLHEIEEVGYQGQDIRLTTFRCLTSELKRIGCSASMIKGLGISIGIEKLKVTPTQLRILISFIDHEGIAPQSALIRSGLGYETSDRDIQHNLYVELSRLRKVLEKNDTGLRIEQARIQLVNRGSQLAENTAYRLG